MVGFVMILAGALVVFAAALRSAGKGEGRVKGGAVVLIGPIPIAFGTDAKWTAAAVALAIVLFLLALVLFL
jgi:uncharacterized protein (TIGR00304 family)